MCVSVYILTENKGRKEGLPTTTVEKTVATGESPTVMPSRGFDRCTGTSQTDLDEEGGNVLFCFTAQKKRHHSSEQLNIKTIFSKVIVNTLKEQMRLPSVCQYI